MWRRWRERCKWRGFPSPPSFKGKRWGKSLRLFLISNTITEWHNHYTLLLWMNNCSHCQHAIAQRKQLPFHLRRWSTAGKLNQISEIWKKEKKAEVQKFCCASPSNNILKTNQRHHYIHNFILHWLDHIAAVWDKTIKRKVNFPHCLPLKEGGEENPLFSSFSTPTQP